MFIPEVGVAAVPVVAVVPLVPVGTPAFGSSVAFSGPSSAVRLAWTFEYDARHSLWVVINSLKFEMS